MVNSDVSPHLGHPAASFPHGKRFLDWARERGQTTIAHNLLALLGDIQTEEALGSALEFLTQFETARALSDWAEHPAAGSLLALSEELSTSPQLAKPLPPGIKPTQAFRSTLSDYYLSAQLAARPDTQLPADQKRRLHRLRVWLLVTAYDALRTGYVRESGLSAVCTQLRMGLDAREVESGNPKETEKLLNRVRWFSGIAPHEVNFAQFTTALTAKLDGQETGDDSGLNLARGALRRLTRRDYRHFKSSSADAPFSEGLHFSSTGLRRQSAELVSGANELTAEGLEIRELPTDPDETSSRLLEVRLEESTTTSELHAVSRRLALQTDEERQHLNISWARLSPWETDLLRTKLHEGLASTDEKTQLLCATAVVAIFSQLSMRSIDHIGVHPPRNPSRAGTPAVWTLDLHAGTLSRVASRHIKAAQRPPELEPWTAEITEQWVLKLSPLLVQPIAAAWARHPDATKLGDLFDGSAETAFNQWLGTSPDLWRVSSGFLAVTGEQQVFEQTKDLTFSRLLFNWPNSATSGAMAYPGWTRQQVAEGFQEIGLGSLATLSTTDSYDDPNAMGSRLGLLDIKIAAEFRRAGERVAQMAQTTDWVTFHNAFTVYCVTGLLIMTGARPARSIFERLAHFDLERGRVFVDDKASLEVVGDKSGRVIPLPRAAIKLLRDLYLPYLRHLHRGLLASGASLATALATALVPSGIPNLPLFFRLRHSNPDEWLEVTESALVDRRIFDWPLPANAFRHRMATALRSAGLDPELVDAHLGHAEAGSETFGDMSVRCWIDEEPRWRQCIEQALEPLDLVFSPFSYPTPTFQSTAVDFTGTTRLFGIESRRLTRDSIARTAREETRGKFEAFLNRKPLAARSAQDWEQLRDEILFDEKGNARPAGFHRYQALQEQLSKLRREHGVTVSIKSWVLPQNPGKAAFGAACLLATDKLDRLRLALDRAYAVIGHSVPSRRTCAWICVTDLALHSGLSDPDSLACVANAVSERLALLVIRNVAYLEISCEGHSAADGPVQRHAIPLRSLPLLSHLISPSKTKIYDRQTATEAAIKELVGAMDFPDTPDINGWVHELCHWSDHYNSLHRPGLQGGVLSGRVGTYALSRTDFVAAQFGERLLTVERINPASTTSTNTSSNSNRDQRRRDNRKPGNAKGALGAHALLAALRRAVNAFQDRRVRTTSAPEAPSTPSAGHMTRAMASSKMREAIRNASAEVPRNVLILADWGVHLLESGTSRKKKELAGSTVDRYLSALSSGFLALSHAVDITEADPEEVTAFYQHVIDPTLTGSAEHVNSSPKKAQKYVLDRLIEFHRYAQRYGAVSPYWDEISEGLTNAAVSPGFITPAEYSHALKLLCPIPHEAHAIQLQRAFFLLLTYRFGLRGAEAVHLSMRNWVDVAQSTVLVVDHRHKKLKTTGSRRKIPLIYPLDAFERSIVDAWGAFRLGSTDFSAERRLLVNVDGQTDLSDLDDLRAHVVAALRMATCNDEIKLHHARHSLANLVGIALIARDSQASLWANALAVNISEDYHSHIRTLLLGSSLPTRRSLWATSRMLGHSRRETTCSSYLHFLLDWCNQTSRLHFPVPHDGQPKPKLAHVTYLDQVERAAAPNKAPGSVVAPVYCRAGTAEVMEYLRSRSRGLSPAQAATGTFGRMSRQTTQRLEEQLQRFTLRISGAVQSETSESSTAPSWVDNLARSVPLSRWPKLMELARACKTQHLPQSALDQISSGLQLVLAQEQHFFHLRLLTETLKLSAQDIKIRTPDQPNAKMFAFLYATNLQGFLEGSQAGKRRRIDSFESSDEKDPGTYGHRFAALVPPKSSSVFTDARGLVTLWVCLAMTDDS